MLIMLLFTKEKRVTYLWDVPGIHIVLYAELPIFGMFLEFTLYCMQFNPLHPDPSLIIYF